MAAPERGFQPETQARIQRKAEREQRLKAAAAEALDFGKPRPQVNDSLEAGVSEVLGTTAERTALRTARDPRAIQQAQRALAAKKAELRGEQAVGQPQGRRPTIDEYLEGLSEGQRETIEYGAWFLGVDECHQADVRRRLAALEEVEEEAEYEFQMWKEEQELVANEEAEASQSWPEEPDFRGAALAAQSDAANAEWYSDDTGEGWEAEEEDE
jgi:hypothetical protein